MGSALFDLSGKVAVVVGGTSGIGRTMALGLAEAGADVVVTGRRETHVDAVAHELESRGRRTLRSQNCRLQLSSTWLCELARHSSPAVSRIHSAGLTNTSSRASTSPTRCSRSLIVVCGNAYPTPSTNPRCDTVWAIATSV